MSGNHKNIFLLVGLMSMPTLVNAQFSKDDKVRLVPDTTITVNGITIHIASHLEKIVPAVLSDSADYYKSIFSDDLFPNVRHKALKGHTRKTEKRDVWRPVSSGMIGEPDDVSFGNEMKYRKRISGVGESSSEFVDASELDRRLKEYWNAAMAPDPRDRTVDHYDKLTSSIDIDVSQYVQRDFVNDFDITNSSPKTATSKDGSDGKKLYYFQKLSLGGLQLSANSDYLLVVDTLEVLKNSFISMKKATIKDRVPTVYIVANNISYADKAKVNLPKLEKGWFREDQVDKGNFVFTANEIYYTGSDTTKYFFTRTQFKGKTAAHALSFQPLTQRLISQNRVALLEQLFTKINATSKDRPKYDHLICRFTTVRHSIEDDLDQGYQIRFAKICDQFDKSDFDPSTRRLVDGRSIFVDRSKDIPKYYILPTNAEVVVHEVDKEKKLGIIQFDKDARGTLTLDVRLQWNDGDSVKGFNVNKDLPPFVQIDDQAIAIHGNKVKLIHSGNSRFHLEFDFATGALLIAQLFPKKMDVDFVLTYKVNGEPHDANIKLCVDSELLTALDYNNYRRCFDVLIYNAQEKAFVILNELTEPRELEGAFHHVEVTISFKSGGKVYDGLPPFYLTAKEERDFFRVVEKDVTILVTGRAYYEKGYIDLKPFETTHSLIVIGESLLVTEL